MSGWRALILFCAINAGCAGASEEHRIWPQWQAFSSAFIADNGRVVDWTANARTVSEGQAYAMFFALVANDPEMFERLLDWTATNLANDDLAKHLPAWLWGQNPAHEQGILDSNPATDADLWIAYDLLEASRLWNKPEYKQLALAMLAQVRQRSIKQIADGPALLMPGPKGFDLPDRVRLNPSYYVPVQLLRFEAVDPQGPWKEMLKYFVASIDDVAPSGRVPDWSQYKDGHHAPDPDTGGIGSYDAIRVYLWSGFGPSSNAQVRKLRAALRSFAAIRLKSGEIPEKWTAGSSLVEGRAPVGYAGALLPFYAAVGDAVHLKQARAQLQEAYHDGAYGNPARYYDQVLALFGQGYDEGRFRFDERGRLIPQWKH